MKIDLEVRKHFENLNSDYFKTLIEILNEENSETKNQLWIQHLQRVDPDRFEQKVYMYWYANDMILKYLPEMYSFIEKTVCSNCYAEKSREQNCFYATVQSYKKTF